MRVHSLAAVTIAFAVVACTDATMPVATSPVKPAFSISDGAHGDEGNSGNPFFYFLPPMVANPGSGTNVTGLAPVVEICVLDGGACMTPSLAHFTTDLSTTTTTQPGNSETVRDGGDHYIVNWHTAAFNLATAATYRVCVSVGNLALGHADVDVVGRANDLKKVNTDEYVGLLDNWTLPIEFRIEDGALLDQAADDGCSAPAELGTISGTVTVFGALVSGYTVYLLDQTGAEVTSTVTDDNGAYTFTSSQLVARTSYLVWEANPSALDAFLSEVTPGSGGSCNNSLIYGEIGYEVTAPASNEPGVAGQDFVNDTMR